ncbi:MAG: 4-hydroxy-tetrahydrodipicolinate synthase [Synergistaceae bacterium]|nr:4-hydroxy-tetrahydrodipicolinate synthase [Synergistaceae bacterium]
MDTAAVGTKLKGIMTALVTPLDKNGNVDETKLRDLVSRQIKAGIHGFLVLGGTGEYCALSRAERVRAVESTVNESKGRVVVIAGVLDPGIGDSIESGLAFKKAGADALLTLVPYYVHPTQEGIHDFFMRVCDAINMPIMIYNIPYRTMVNCLPETVERLVDDDKRIVGIKQCNTNLAESIDLVRRAGDRIALFSGEDFLFPSQFMIGMKNAMIASTNLIPDLWMDIYDKLVSGKYEEAFKLHKELYPLIKAIYAETNPGPMKWGMNKIGLPGGELSIPLVEPSAATKENLLAAMKNWKLV